MQDSKSKSVNKPLVIGGTVVIALIILIGAIALGVSGTPLVTLTVAVSVGLGMSIVRVLRGEGT